MAGDKAETSKKARRGRPVALGRLLPAIASKTLRSRGFLHQDIIARWADIVGPEAAAMSRPLAIRFPRGKRSEAALEVRVSPAFAPLFQHQGPQIIARINGYFGYAAIARLSIAQGRIEANAPARAPQSERPASEQAIRFSKGLTKDIRDDKLRALLSRWGASLKDKGVP